jgi:cytochrome c556
MEEVVMIRSILMITALSLGIGAAMAQNDPIATRKETMKQVGRANAEVAKISKGEAPFKLETIQAALKTIQDASKTMPNLFPDNSKTGGDTTALPKVWETKADFNARWEKMGKDAGAASAKIVDEASFKVAYGEVTSNCGGCHEGYRQKR